MFRVFKNNNLGRENFHWKVNPYHRKLLRTVPGLICDDSCFLIFFFLFQEPTAIPSREKRKKWVCQRLVCRKREFAAIPSSCEVSRCEV